MVYNRAILSYILSHILTKNVKLKLMCLLKTNKNIFLLTYKSYIAKKLYK